MLYVYGVFDLSVFKVFWGHWCTCPKMTCNSKMAGRRVKQNGIWDSRSCAMFMGYLWPFSVQGGFEVIRCTCLKIPCNLKMAGYRVNGLKFGTQVDLVSIWGTFDLLVFKVILGHSVHFISKWTVTENGWL